MRRTALLVIIMLGLALRIAYAAAIYEPSLVVYHGGDYELYRVGAEDILRGDLAFSSDLYLLRPPLFPLLIALLQMQSLAILAANILLSSFVIPFAFILARQLRLPRRLALLAALIVALDPTSIKYAGVLQAEPLANLLLALSFVAFIKVWRAENRLAILTLGLISGIFVILSSLTRPAAYLLWIPMALWAGFARRAVAGGGGVSGCFRHYLTRDAWRRVMDAT